MKIYILLVSVLFLASACQEITNFEECIAAGNPAMESYPRQCRAGDRTFTEEIDTQPTLTLEQAVEIAQNTECTEKGELKQTSDYNGVTKTWWIDLEMKEEFKNELCNPACVIKETTKTAEINWRCTGALPQ